jgi:AbrB family looped-hinge helix DNA binding protein
MLDLPPSYEEAAVTTTKLSTKGQLILPKEVRERRGWQAGTVLELVERGDAVLIRRVEAVPETTLQDLIGCTGYRGPARSIEEMDAAVEREARERR